MREATTMLTRRRFLGVSGLGMLSLASECQPPALEQSVFAADLSAADAPLGGFQLVVIVQLTFWQFWQFWEPNSNFLKAMIEWDEWNPTRSDDRAHPDVAAFAVWGVFNL